MTILCRPNIIMTVRQHMLLHTLFWNSLLQCVMRVCVCIRWARAARPASESRLSALPLTLAQDSGCRGSTKAKHLPGQECHHLANVCLNLLWLISSSHQSLDSSLGKMVDVFITTPGPIQQQRQQQPRVATVLQLMLWLLLWMPQLLPHRWMWPRWRSVNMNVTTTCLLDEQPASPNSSNRRQKGDPCSHHMVQCLCQGVSPIQLTLRVLGSWLRIRALQPQSLALKRSFGLVARRPSQQPTSLMSS